MSTTSSSDSSSEGTASDSATSEGPFTTITFFNCIPRFDHIPLSNIQRKIFHLRDKHNLTFEEIAIDDEVMHVKLTEREIICEYYSTLYDLILNGTILPPPNLQSDLKPQLFFIKELCEMEAPVKDIADALVLSEEAVEVFADWLIWKDHMKEELRPRRLGQLLAVIPKSKQRREYRLRRDLTPEPEPKPEPVPKVQLDDGPERVSQILEDSYIRYQAQLGGAAREHEGERVSQILEDRDIRFQSRGSLSLAKNDESEGDSETEHKTEKMSQILKHHDVGLHSRGSLNSTKMEESESHSDPEYSAERTSQDLENSDIRFQSQESLRTGNADESEDDLETEYSAERMSRIMVGTDLLMDSALEHHSRDSLSLARTDEDEGDSEIECSAERMSRILVDSDLRYHSLQSLKLTEQHESDSRSRSF